MNSKLQEYAKLLVRTGVNLKQGQRLNISAQVDAAEFARLCAEEAFAAGAADVTVKWEDDTIDRLHYLYGADEIFDEPDPHSDAYWHGFAARGDADLRIAASDPIALEGVDPSRIVRESRARRVAKKPVMDRMRAERMQWCVGAYPTKAWASRVFPELPAEEAVQKLWDAVFDTCLVTGDGTAPEKWAEKQKEFKRRVALLNRCAFRELIYHSALGTDLTVGLPEGHFWEGGASLCEGRPMLPNIPTEEVYTSPHRLRVNGTIASSLPLFLNGTRVENIRMTLKDGRIVKASATRGEEALLSKLDTDEGARYLGECALVSWDSPIRRTGILFQETLFDENASCHFAFGNAYPLVRGAAEMTEEHRLAVGLNVSDTHIDFMIGTEDLSVTGVTADGRHIAVMRDGAFVLE